MKWFKAKLRYLFVDPWRAGQRSYERWKDGDNKASHLHDPAVDHEDRASYPILRRRAGYSRPRVGAGTIEV